MSFNDIEASRSLGSPDTLYRFTYQEQVLAYTDSEEPIVFLGIVYSPIPVQRGSLTTSGTLDKSQLNIDLPRTTAIAELYRVFPPTDVVGVIVFQGHAESGVDFVAVWTGRVLSCKRALSTATVVCEPISTSMKRPGLRRRYQYGCPHVLYGPACRVDRTAFASTASVIAVSQALVTLSANWNGAFEPSNFVDGLLGWTAGGIDRLCTILRVDTGAVQITVSGQTASLAISMTVVLNPGCNHQLSGCSTFDNNLNYGGQPWIPLQNPIGLVNQFY